MSAASCKCRGYFLLAEPYDRVMQLNWLYFCGICQLIPGCGHGITADTTETVAEHSASAINQLACSSYSLYIQLLWYPMYYPRGMKAQISPVQWSKPSSIYIILAPLKIRTRAAGFRIISGDHYTTTASRLISAGACILWQRLTFFFDPNCYHYRDHTHLRSPGASDST